MAAVLAGSPSTHATVSDNVNPAVDRPGHELADLRDPLGWFLRAYAFLVQVVKLTDEELESLFLYGRSARRKHADSLN